VIPSLADQLVAYQRDSHRLAAEDRARKDRDQQLKAHAKRKAAGKKQVKKAKRGIAFTRKSA